MIQKRDFNSLRAKIKKSFLGFGLFSMVICLSTQMLHANYKSTLLTIDLPIPMQSTITGTVSDAVGPLPGANVLVKGSTNGTQTDFDGNYSLENVAEDATLVISYIGFKTVEIAVGGQTSISVTLEEDASKLEEVVVTGYGTQRKKDLTGAVAVVDTDELLATPATTFSQQLQGRAAGVSIINDARPGGEATVRIRGFGTAGNNDPLYVIDGVPTQAQSNLNPNDIESLQILKDASAASIYGSRAANGVIIITTKKGKLGTPTITYDTYYGMQTAAENAKALNAAELGQYLYLADLYAGKSPSHGQYTYNSAGPVIPDYVFPSGAFEGDPAADPSLYSLVDGNIYAITRSADTNWWEETTRSAPIQSHNISASGATDAARYAFSLGYFSQDFITKFTSYDRVSLRANTEFKGLDGKLTIGENFTASFDNLKGNFDNDEEQNTVSAAYKHHPLLPIYDIAGNFAGSRGANLGNNYNPYARLKRDEDDRTYRLRILGNVYANYDLTKNLSIRSSFGVDSRIQRERDLGRPQPEYVEGNFINSSEAREEYEYAWTWTNTLSYTKTFNEVHNFAAYVGVESIQQFEERFGARRERFAFETANILSYLDLGNATTSSNYGYVEQDYSLWSQFGKLNYDYNGKYLAQFILRNDSSSRFQSASRSAVFPAFSLGWRVSDEGFMDNVEWINDMKVRYGWGQTGNQQIGDYNAYTTYKSDIITGGYPIDGSTGSPTIGFSTSAFGNPNAKWETTTSNNFGLDLVMFNNKITFNLDLWNRITTDMLLQVPSTFTAGQVDDEPSFNVGGITNKGVDISLGFNDSKGDFSYGISANLSTYTNNVDFLDSPDTKIFGDSRRVPSLTVTQEGSPLSSFYGYQIEGIFQTQAEADAWPTYEGYNAPGKFKVADINGDGEIDDADRTIIGSPHPDFTYGLNLDVSYKNLSLNVFANGSQGNEIYNYVRYFADFNTFQGNRSQRALYDAWQPSNPTAPVSQWTAANPGATSPIMDADDNISSRPSTYFLEDGSFLRIKNVQLTYAFPDQLLEALNISRASIYLQGQNLHTFTSYSGLNPEIQTGDNQTLGYDGGYLPVSRTFLLGLNITLN